MSHTIHTFNSKYPPTTEQNWRDLTEKFIKGADFDETLVQYTEDGIARGPLFSKHNSEQSQFVRRNHLSVGGPWHIGTHINHPDIKISNEDALSDLNGGASLVLIDPGHDGVFGVDIRSKTDIQRLLSGVYTKLAPISLLPSDRNFETAAVLASHFQSNADIKETQVSLGYAPIGDENNQLVSIANWVREYAPHWQAISVNARFAHEAGGSPGHELAFMLSLGNHYLRQLLDAGIGIETALKLMDIYLAVDQDSHQNIIKLRAARLLWAKMAESYGADKAARSSTIHVVSSERMMSKMDPWSNMLRLNSASFGGVCGGADSVTILPFTYALGLPTSFARRISRNIQNMMREESHLGHVDDPAHGSFMHETLTFELAEMAWKIFQEIESKGGWHSANAKHWFVSELERTRDERAATLHRGESLLVGVNQYEKPDVRAAKIRRAPTIKTRDGDLIDTTDFSGAVAQANDGKLAPEFSRPSLIKKVRLSEPFENLGTKS